MFIECWRQQFAPYLWSFVMFVYRCKREYYLSEFKVLFLIYGELTVSETKRVINNLKCQLSRGDCSYSLCIRANKVIKMSQTNQIVINQFDKLILQFQLIFFWVFWVLSNFYLSYCVPWGTALQKYPIFFQKQAEIKAKYVFTSTSTICIGIQTTKQ